MISAIIESMKFSPMTTLIVVVMLLLLAALLVLAFILGNHYAVSNLRSSLSSTLPSSTSTPAEVPQTASEPPITLPSVPRSDDAGLERWLRGTVLRAAPLPFGSEVTLAMDDPLTPRGAVAENNAVYLYFVDVVYDSRCPDNVDCISGGEAIVEVQVKASNKPTQTIYLSSRTGGKPDAWTYHGLVDDSFMTPAVKEEIARGQQRVMETTYATGQNYNDGAAIVDRYRISLRSVTPSRINSEELPVKKETYRASFVVTPVE